MISVGCVYCGAMNDPGTQSAESRTGERGGVGASLDCNGSEDSGIARTWRIGLLRETS